MDPKCIFVAVCIILSTIAETETKKSDLKKFLDHMIEATFDSKGAIGKINGCSDYGSWCKKYERYCSSVPAVQQYCKVTCNICPKPTTTTTTTTTPVPTDSDCKDTHPQCDVAFQRGYCTGRKQHVDFMKRNCPKTCNFCARTCEAVDANPGCHRMTKYCTNKNYEDYMRKNCVKTCGFCKKETKCGIPKLRSLANKSKTDIVGGVETQKGFYPWQVAIYYDDDFRCGGTLISDKHVITAAHCFKYLSKDNDRYKVVLGDHDRSSNEGTEETKGVISIEQHKDYKYQSDTHDIAIMELDTAVVFTDVISAICLPTQEEVLPVGSKCYVTGWGKTRHDGLAVDRLMEISVPIVDRKHCKERNTFNNHDVNDKMICAGYNDGTNYQTACFGDSGGPLACEKPDKSWVLYGVVSWGSPQCSGLEHYTVFTRVSKYINWINEEKRA